MLKVKVKKKCVQTALQQRKILFFLNYLNVGEMLPLKNRYSVAKLFIGFNKNYIFLESNLIYDKNYQIFYNHFYKVVKSAFKVFKELYFYLINSCRHSSFLFCIFTTCNINIYFLLNPIFFI